VRHALSLVVTALIFFDGEFVLIIIMVFSMFSSRPSTSEPVHQSQKGGDPIHHPPMFPAPFHTNKKLVIVLTNTSKMEKSGKPTGFDIRDLAHICEIMYRYVYHEQSDQGHGHHGHIAATTTTTDNLTTPPKYPATTCNRSGCPHDIEHASNPFDHAFFSKRFIIATILGGEAPIDPMCLEEGQKDFVTKEFMHCDYMMKLIRSTKRWAEISPEDCFGVIFTGGHGTLVDLATNEEGGRWLQKFYTSGGIIAAVCHGPAALLSIPSRELLSEKEDHWIRDKKLTCFSNEEERLLKMDKDMPYLLEDKLREAGASVDISDPFDIHVVTSERLITGQNSESVRTMVKTFLQVATKKMNEHTR
jgi:putative intracellular protease/amidase